MSNKSSTVLAVALTVALGAASSSACKNQGEPTGSTCPEGSTLTYETFGQAFMKTYCLDCHSSGHGEQPILDTVAEIRAASADVDRTSAAGPDATNDVMPTDRSISDAERQKLGEWLACGAP